MVYLMRYLLKEVESRIITHENNVLELEENLEVLHELEKYIKVYMTEVIQQSRQNCLQGLTYLLDMI